MSLRDPRAWLALRHSPNRQINLRCSISLFGFSITEKPLLLSPDSHYREGNENS